MGRGEGPALSDSGGQTRTTLRALRGFPMVMPHAPMTATSLLLVEDDEFVRLSLARALNRAGRSEEHTSELQSRLHLVCRLLLEKKKKKKLPYMSATEV